MGNISGHVNFLAGQVITANGQTQGFSVQNFQTLALQINVSAIGGTTPSLQFFLETSADNVNWVGVAQTAAITANGNTLISVGAGTANNNDFGDFVRLRYTITGTSPTATVTAIGVGKG